MLFFGLFRIWCSQQRYIGEMSLNVGVLGHVDSGKTTLTRALAEIASTAALDKHAESGGRKNTLDLGFSCFTVASRRLVLIDCPGHASLIKAVLAAGTVFDMALVIPSIVKKVRKAVTTLGVAESSPIVPISLINSTKNSIQELIGIIEEKVFEPRRVNSGRQRKRAAFAI
ncbi:hypothetical protein DICVIV_00215 [Dictyocaulus viviparus]|uniref:Tr-type G domain-containing protein n=1 Tax=Dictyocaulus viviparus TaxID=29172 RepID=A0A0D8YBQ3_DICVI|nr:hypothetical protein DICVIV_00215 [Dictyocaulus viviparus]